MKEYNIHISCHLFFATCKTKENNKLFNENSLLEKSTNEFLCVKPTKDFLSIKNIICLKLNVLAHFLTSLIYIFHFLVSISKK